MKNDKISYNKLSMFNNNNHFSKKNTILNSFTNLINNKFKSLFSINNNNRQLEQHLLISQENKDRNGMLKEYLRIYF